MEYNPLVLGFCRGIRSITEYSFSAEPSTVGGGGGAGAGAGAGAASAPVSVKGILVEELRLR